MRLTNKTKTKLFTTGILFVEAFFLLMTVAKVGVINPDMVWVVLALGFPLFICSGVACRYMIDHSEDDD